MPARFVRGKVPVWFVVLTFPGWVILGVYGALIYDLGEMRK